MGRHPLDQDHDAQASERPERFARLDRLKAGEGQHPKIKMLDRRRKGTANPSRVKQYLRIARGYLA